MFSLNLLPWRLEQHQKAFRHFMWQGLIWLACSVLMTSSVWLQSLPTTALVIQASIKAWSHT